jgi:hypothetical protein
METYILIRVLASLYRICMLFETDESADGGNCLNLSTCMALAPELHKCMDTVSHHLCSYQICPKPIMFK